MKSEFSISEDEYIKANKLYTKPSKKVYLVFLMLGMFTVAMHLFSVPSIFVYAVGGACIGGIVGQELVRHFYASIKTRGVYRSYKAAQEPIKMELSDNGILLSAESGESILQWERLSQWREDDRFILIYQNDYLYHLIPKRLGDITVALRGQLVKYVGKPR